MRIALVHDYLKEYGGAESVFEALSDIFPESDIFTAVYRPQSLGPHRNRLQKKWHGRVHQSFFGYLPFAGKLLSPLRFLSPLAFRSFDFSGYDLIITSATGAFFPNSLNKKSARLVCYCHTPPRYLYRLATARSLDTWFYKLINIPLQILLHFYRLLDFKYAQNVDQFVANSATTSARIRKFYRRDSLIINPPVDLPDKAKSGVLGAQSSERILRGREHRKMTDERYFLTGGRLARAKRYDIAIQACNQLKVPLKIFGRDLSGCEAELKALAGLSAVASAKVEPTIEFLGEISQSAKNELLSHAKAFIFSSDNEDFGIVSVEAQGFGCPVIGYRSGGIAETVIDGKTGILFDDLTPESCVKAIQQFEKTKFDPKVCISNAQNFSKEKFITKIQKLTSEIR
jgi:glycosyltransferase involved in cell wall biosynthesis